MTAEDKNGQIHKVKRLFQLPRFLKRLATEDPSIIPNFWKYVPRKYIEGPVFRIWSPVSNVCVPCKWIQICHLKMTEKLLLDISDEARRNNCIFWNIWCLFRFENASIFHYYYQANLSELVYFYVPWNHLITYRLLIISGGIEVTSLNETSSSFLAHEEQKGNFLIHILSKSSTKELRFSNKTTD